jgi:DNA-binding Lrp family transcriptional regulator
MSGNHERLSREYLASILHSDKEKAEMLKALFQIRKSFDLTTRDLASLLKVSPSWVWKRLKDFESSGTAVLRPKDIESIKNFMRRVLRLFPAADRILDMYKEPGKDLFVDWLFTGTTVLGNTRYERFLMVIKRMLKFIAIAPRRDKLRKLFFKL